ncbi:unnamed protein product [Miscanthus lutarioriparius]|uniref:Uncharacterized protein n=1 Tax=Miscanthus lutarioriparius TaxID=422564 RepID=A0A811S3R4_9POAL|nr:unnamed protein product [Miscanthus lutarioriparius]
MAVLFHFQTHGLGAHSGGGLLPREPQLGLESAVRSYYDSADGEPDAGAADPVPPPPDAPAGGGEDTEDEDYVVGGGGGDEDEDDEDYVDGDDGDDEDAALAAEAVAEEERRRPVKKQKRSHDTRGGSGSRSGSRARAGGASARGIGMVDQSKRKNNTDEVFKQAKRKGLSKPPEEIVHNIYFWRNGFTVNDGPLRSFDDPANASFLKSIKDSVCPTELEPADGKSKVNVNLVRKEEEFTEPVKRAAPFEGERRTLMEPSDNNTSSAAAPSSVTAPRAITVDDSLPSTSLQIRFADGSRLVARFNTSHTISDVRAFIDATRPEASDYTLQAGFPPKPLEDATKTIEEAGVANSVIIQSV